jgi:uncharacterized protein (DUF4415 family)
MKTKLDPALQEEAERLAVMSDDPIDTVDIPEAPADSWSHATRGGLYRPVKQPVTLRLDADLVRWFKSHAAGRPYQTEMNRVLRRHVALSGGFDALERPAD